MTCTARRCNTVLLEGYRKKAVIIAGAAEYGDRELGKCMEIKIKI